MNHLFADLMLWLMYIALFAAIAATVASVVKTLRMISQRSISSPAW